MIASYSATGIAFVVIVIVLLILVSIQFTLNQILREIREIRKKTDRRDQDSYKGSVWDE